ncbi:MAG: hypothetical protein ACREGR_04020 [Minisyncoccia bacterium]
MRRTLLVLGLVAAAVGTWSLYRVHSEAVGCTLSSLQSPTFGASSTCLNQVWLEYTSFGVLLAGLFAMAIALLLMRRRSHAPAEASHRRYRYVGTPGEARAEVPDPSIVRRIREDEPPREAGRPSTAA